jgi:anhydro-N-acetylmuramic acid kinase
MLVAGVMSGTSLDGIDVALVEIRGSRVVTTGFLSTPHPAAVRQAILSVSNTTTTTAQIARLHFRLGELYAAALLRAFRKFGKPDLIGCHGQTIYHEGGSCTLQIGEPAVIAERTGIPVISDFRKRDIAAGGEGAPLVPFVDYLLFRHPRLTRVALNIGGIANITVIPAGATADKVIAFDTGPGNMVIDALVTDYTEGRQNYDQDGHLAAQGHIDRKLLNQLLLDPYYRRRPPKSAGREQFGAEFVSRLKRAGLSPLDRIATASALTATSIALAVRPFEPVADLIVSGGGARNRWIMDHLAALLPRTAIANSGVFGVHADAKEAIAFAILAYQTWRRRPANLPSATGAHHPVILGNLTFA